MSELFTCLCSVTKQINCFHTIISFFLTFYIFFHFVHESMSQILNNFIFFISHRKHFNFFTDNQSYSDFFSKKTIHTNPPIFIQLGSSLTVIFNFTSIYINTHLNVILCNIKILTAK